MFPHRYKAILILFLLSLSSLSLAESERKTDSGKVRSGWYYGLFASDKASLYEGISEQAKLLPAIGYKSPSLNIFGPFASYRLYNNSRQGMKLFVHAHYKSLGFDSKDSARFNTLTDRKSSFFAGLTLEKKLDNWTFRTAYSKDIQGRSNGEEVKLSASYFYNIGPFFIRPSADLTFQNRTFTRYYFGVNSQEENGLLRYYQPSDSFSPGLGLSLSTPIFFGGFTRLSMSEQWLDKQLSDSPLLDKKRAWQVTLTFTRFF